MFFTIWDVDAAGSNPVTPTKNPLDRMIPEDFLFIMLDYSYSKVERSHRKDNERFYATHTFYSFEDFSKQLKIYNRKDYNNFPMRPLGWKTPKEVLDEFLATKCNT